MIYLTNKRVNFVSLSAMTHPAARHSAVQRETANCTRQYVQCVRRTHFATAHRGLVRHVANGGEPAARLYEQPRIRGQAALV